MVAGGIMGYVTGYLAGTVVGSMQELANGLAAGRHKYPNFARSVWAASKASGHQLGLFSMGNTAAKAYLSVNKKVDSAYTIDFIGGFTGGFFAAGMRA